MVPLHWTKGLPELQIKIVFNDISSWATGSNSIPHDALYQSCTNGFAPAKMGLAELYNKKYLQMKSPEPLVQNQNNFTEMVLMLPSTKIDQKVQLGWTTWLPELKIEVSLNHMISP